MSIERLEMELIALGRTLDLPETPDLVAATRRRIEGGAARRPPVARRRLRTAAIVALGLLLPVGVALAVSSDLRERVRDWLGFDAVVVEEVETLPPIETGGLAPSSPVRRSFELVRAQTPRAPIAPGVGVPLAAAREAVDFDLRLPASLGRPRSVYLAGSGGQARVSVTWTPRDGLPPMRGRRVGLLMTQLRGSVDGAILKQVVDGTGRRFLRVGPWNAVALLDAPHAVTFRGLGGDIQIERTRLAVNTLLVSRGSVLVRIEADAPLATLVRIAREVA